MNSILSPLRNLAAAIVSFLCRPSLSEMEEFLNKSADACDLENRQRLWDQRQHDRNRFF